MVALPGKVVLLDRGCEGAIRTARSWLRHSGDAGDLGPSLDGLPPGGLILDGGHLMAAEVFAALRVQRMRLRHDQHVPEWSG